MLVSFAAVGPEGTGLCAGESPFPELEFVDVAAQVVDDKGIW